MGMIAPQANIQEPDLLTEILHNTGVIKLNRPKALNSLNVEIIRGLSKTLESWQTLKPVKQVIIEGSGEKAFCAGGDVRSVYYARQGDNFHLMDEIFREEYQLNYAISCYPKPYIALIHGICMGGGLGVSVHGTYRIVTDNTIMAMPETAIGFFPDIGATYFLNQCPGDLGVFLGVMGERIHAGDALYSGLATHYVPQKHWSSLKADLYKVTDEEEIDNVLQQYHQPKVSEKLESWRHLIDQTFAGHDIDIVIDRLKTSSNPIVQGWWQELKKKSPRSVKLSFAALRKARGLSLKEALIQEYRLSQACMNHPDFFEGVRALLVDKDNQPLWQPHDLDLVTKDMIESYFEPLGEKELELPK
jgi:enoyl-CoA hydratase/3-hydroxyisobutyryl-CoA hydrolase